MNQLLVVLSGYLLLGGLVLAVLDSRTGRIRNRLAGAAEETQGRMAGAGSYVGHRTALVLILCALWVFWPAAIYGALSTKRDGKERS